MVAIMTVVRTDGGCMVARDGGSMMVAAMVLTRTLSKILRKDGGKI